ncbi:putative Xaa-Pro dipeptidase ASCRUDRAFT_9453 [Ascoidea rubescens DSM 1968]|uniref:Aminopeptidase P N-terminal domain-containing protein n=1 Tax=Ascoidea rubescens DSM 1968 TaxID=1344418 RepID=A0A1D2VD16_9ASCO|nr:hypothetical protein ASCRUDRAFT_9453 [Ascoidea rubescens DSM 1968]ODV59393.1 hypothetical protein ASCRUDRAFT_9453 [Ascoidea rubescens DSM 1968]
MSSPEELTYRKYPAKLHCENVKKNLLSKTSLDPSTIVIFLSGEGSKLYPHSDQEQVFRQDRDFFYLSGCNIPNSHLIYDVQSSKLSLFLPNIDNDDVMWSGMPLLPEQALQKFDVDDVHYTNKLYDYFHNLNKNHKIAITNYRSEWNNPYKYFFLKQSDDDLNYALSESRLIKDDYEISLMKIAAKITDNSHLAVMSALPIEKNETHIHAEFIYHSIRQGSKFQAYDPICCSGPNCGTLHYIKNDDTLSNKNSVLIDAGAEWQNYAADVTRCFPINGIWSKEHRQIYDIVLKMQKTVLKQIKPGVLWDDLHLLAHRVLIDSFLKLGIFKKKFSSQEIFDSNASVCFFPHGLGHLLGLSTHDVGGNPNYQDPDPKLRYLRLRRKLLAGMVVTDEPGIYFSPFLIDNALKDEKIAQKIDQSVLENYYYIGGVRIEDDILVTENGHENLTGITSDPDEISKIVTDGINKGRDHFHCIV